MSKRCGVLLTALLLAACDDGREPLEPAAGAWLSDAGAVGPTVMTRNLYLGTDLDPVLAAPLQQLPDSAAAAWAAVQQTNFPARAGALADEIVRTRPHLVGLQEASLYRVQSPGDAVLGGITPASAVAYDFVALLLDSLAARGASYVVAAETQAFDVEIPVYTGAAPFPYDDVRLTDREVILARADVSISNPMGGRFAIGLPLPLGVTVTRGWASVDATVHGHTFRFLSTHLEVQSFAPVQAAQAAELLGIAAASPLPVVMVGDFNSAADGSQTPTYAQIVAAGFQDVWPRGEPGYTCCHAKDLLNVDSELDQRLDIVFLSGFNRTGLGSVGARVHVVGDEPRDRLPSGLWPSDHAGVVATLRLPPASTMTN